MQRSISRRCARAAAPSHKGVLDAPRAKDTSGATLTCSRTWLQAAECLCRPVLSCCGRPAPRTCARYLRWRPVLAMAARLMARQAGSCERHAERRRRDTVGGARWHVHRQEVHIVGVCGGSTRWQAATHCRAQGLSSGAARALCPPIRCSDQA